MNHAALITVLTMFLLLAVMIGVGRARGRYGVKAPATTGPEGFEQALRVQVNTLEGALMFLPSLWLFAIYVSDVWAGIVGAVWLVGRIAYAIGYYQAAAKRSTGFLIGFIATAILMVGSLVGVVQVLAG